MALEPIIIPSYDANTGDTVEHEVQSFVVGEHFANGGKMRDKGFTHIMFNAKGAFGLSVVE